MPTYLWSAKDAAGKQVIERVTAATAAEARAELEARGLTELVLKQDEIMEVSGRLVHNELDEEPDLTPQAQLQMMESRFAPLVYAWNENKKLILLSVLALIWGVSQRDYYWMVRGGLVFSLPVLMVWFGMSGYYYAKLNMAKVARDWKRVLRLVERLRVVQRWTMRGPGDIELSRCRAQALAAVGRLEEGLEEFSRFKDDSRLPHWLYLTNLAGIYDEGKCYAKSVELSGQVTQERPDSVTAWIDYAYRLARHRKDVHAARAALARAEQGEIVDLGKPWLPFVRGLIAIAENNFSAAKPHLLEALEGYEARAHFPLVQSSVLLTKAYLCWVEGALGHRREAEVLFRRIETWLEASKEDELLARCREVIGRA